MEAIDFTVDPPNAVQIELTEGCNLYCSFCGLQGIRTKEDKCFKFLSIEMAEVIADRLVESGWNSRIEFAMHGEPTMNPEWKEILSLFRTELPDLPMMLTTNGGGFLIGDIVTNLRTALSYMNVVAIDAYEYVNIATKLREAAKGRMIFWEYPEEPESNPHRRRDRYDHDLVFIKDISVATKGTHSSLTNHCGAAGPLVETAKRCAKPFRELSIRWDGHIALCCNDWRGAYMVGSIAQSPLEAIWRAPAMLAARRKLYHKLRDFGPCKGCNATSYRVGLLPDKKGKLDLPLPDENDLRVIEEALEQGPYTVPVLRPWEKK